MDAERPEVLVVVRRECDVCEGTGGVSDEGEHVRECGACEDGTGMVEDTMPLAELVALLPRPALPVDDLQALIDTVRVTITSAASKSQGLADADEMGSWLRAVQEGAEALRSLTDLQAR